MLRLMRENAGSWIIKILLGIVVLVFIFLGIGPSDNKTTNTAAVVNEKVITMDEYRVAYNSILEQYRAQFGNNLNDELIKLLGIKNQALESLISRTVIIQEAEKLGLRVTDDELYAAISNMKYFRRNGAFEPELYKRMIIGSGQTPEYFETRKREELLMDKLRAFVTDTVVVSDAEISEWYKWKNARVKVAYRVFASDDITGIKPTDEEIGEFFAKNKERYKTDPKVQVRYLKFSPADYKAQVQVTDAEVASYYEANSERYEKPATVEARHILIKVEEGAEAAAVESARKRAVDIYEKAKAGKDFAELAKEFSEGPTKEKGGYLGTFEKERMVKPFADKAFSMAAGEISEPVRTQFGWHVIQVMTVNKASKQTLAQVTPEIRESMTKERTENLAYDASEAAYDLIIGGDDLGGAAESAGLKAMETGYFSRAGEGLAIDAASRGEFTKAAFGLETDEISDILEMGGSYFIIQVTGKKVPEVPALEVVKERVRKDLVRETQDKRAAEAADKELAALKEGKGFTDKKRVKTTDFFKRDANVKDLDRRVVEASFKLKGEAGLSADVVKGAGGYHVIHLVEREEADASGLEKEREEIRKTLLSRKASDTFGGWLSQVKSESTIERDSRFN